MNEQVAESIHLRLAAAANAAWKDLGVCFTVAIAILATTGGIPTSIPAQQRMLSMLVRVKPIPCPLFGMPADKAGGRND